MNQKNDKNKEKREKKRKDCRFNMGNNHCSGCYGLWRISYDTWHCKCHINRKWRNLQWLKAK